MSNSLNHQLDEDEIDLRELFSTLTRYKYSIVLTMLLFFFGALSYLYFQPSIYSSEAIIEFSGVDKGASVQTDILKEAFSSQGADLDTEIEILRSRYIVSKVLNSIELRKRYFFKENYRTQELYENLPFVVTISYLDSNIDKIKFEVFPQDKDHFILKIGEDQNQSKITKWIEKFKNKIFSNQNKNLYFHYQKHKYGEKISTPWLTCEINRIYELNKPEYSFVVYNDVDLIIDTIQKHLKISQIKKASILKISYEDNIAIRAKELVNSISKAYIEEQLERNKNEAEKSLKFIDNQLAIISKNLKKSEGKLESYKKKNSIVNISASAEGTLQRLTDYESEVSKVELELNILTNLQQYISSGRGTSGISMGMLEHPTPILSSMLESLQQKEVEYRALLIEFTPRHPQVSKIQGQINILKKNIKKSIKNIIRNMKSKKVSLNKTVKKYQKTLSSLPQKEIELGNLKRGFLIDEKVYSYLLQRRTETAIVKASTVSGAKILDEASNPKEPIKPKRNLILLVSVISGLILGIFIAFLREFLNNKIENHEDVEKLTNIPIYGSIPLLKNKKQKSAFSESLKVIRTNLDFIKVENRAKIITITSSVPSEGKTTVISRMGVTIAKGFKKTILIDMDMRKPRLHKEAKIKNDKGVANYLAGEVTLDNILVKEISENLDIITAGDIPPNPSELLMSNKVDELLSELSKKYDYILIDTPPMGLVTDAILLMRKSDISLVVVRSKVSFKKYIQNIERMTSDNDIESVGIIVNAVTLEKKGYGYGYGYGYGEKG